jgi:hypothetical protein
MKQPNHPDDNQGIKDMEENNDNVSGLFPEDQVYELLEYAQHDSWRCRYHQKCHCGLDDLCEKMGIKKVALPEA